MKQPASTCSAHSTPARRLDAHRHTHRSLFAAFSSIIILLASSSVAVANGIENNGGGGTTTSLPTAGHSSSSSIASSIDVGIDHGSSTAPDSNTSNSCSEPDGNDACIGERKSGGDLDVAVRAFTYPACTPKAPVATEERPDVYTAFRDTPPPGTRVNSRLHV